MNIGSMNTEYAKDQARKTQGRRSTLLKEGKTSEFRILLHTYDTPIREMRAPREAGYHAACEAKRSEAKKLSSRCYAYAKTLTSAELLALPSNFDLPPQGKA